MVAPYRHCFRVAILAILTTLSLSALAGGPVKVRGWVSGMKSSDTATVKMRGPRTYRVQTKTSGKWEIKGVMPGKYEISVEQSRYTFQPKSRQVKIGSGGKSGINFKGSAKKAGATESRTYVVSGRVKGLTGLARGKVLARGPIDVQTVTNKKGNFVLQGMVPGDYRILVRAEGFSFTPPEQEVFIRKGSIKGLRFKASKIVEKPEHKPMIAGVVSGLRPGEFAMIRGKGRRRFSYKVTKNGPYEIFDIKKGRYRVWVDVPKCRKCYYMPGANVMDLIEPGKTHIDWYIGHRD
jgi:hypothetical protein